jgi:hypothetical protein
MLQPSKQHPPVAKPLGCLRRREEEIGYNSRGSLLTEQSTVFLASALPPGAATANAPAVDSSAQPATQSPAATLSQSFARVSMLFRPDRMGDGEEHGSSTSLSA